MNRVGWSNRENLPWLACKFDLDQNERNVIANQLKCTQRLAKQSRKHTQVIILHLFANLFGQGFSYVMEFGVNLSEM